MHQALVAQVCAVAIVSCTISSEIDLVNIRFLQTVVWLAELRSFRVTAERMNITPAAISSRVAALEDELGFRLFERDSRDVSPTPAGARFIEGAKDIVRRYDQLLEDTSQVLGPHGDIRIGVLPSMASTLLPAIIGTLRERFPHIRVSVSTESSPAILHHLEQRELDIILGFPGIDRALYSITPLCQFNMIWVSDKDYPHDDDPLVRAERLRASPIISYEVGTQNHRRLTDYMLQAGFEEAIVHYSNSLATTIGMVSAGIGLSVLPAATISAELQAGTLRTLDVDQNFPPTDYFAVCLRTPTSRLAPRVAAIAAECAEVFCAQMGPGIARML